MRKHRQHLRQSLEDLDSTVKAVDTFLAVFIGIVIMLLLLIIFSQGDFAEVTVTTSTSIFALSFIFAETAKNLFNSFVFLFLRHPFDVGDRVHIGSNSSDPYYVLKMELLTTTFTMWSGECVHYGGGCYRHFLSSRCISSALDFHRCRFECHRFSFEFYHCFATDAYVLL